MKDTKFITKDVYLTSYLISIGHPFFSAYVSKIYERKVEFSFPKTSALMDEIRKYMAGSALVEPVRFIEHFKRTRGIIYSVINQEARNGRLED